MPTFREKPVEVQAVQYLGFEVNGEEVERFLGDDFESHIPSRDQVLVRTVEGELAVDKGDWIIRDRHGDYYRCKPDVFGATYEMVDPTHV